MKAAIIATAWGLSLVAIGNQRVPKTLVDRFGTSAQITWVRIPNGVAIIGAGTTIAAGGIHAIIKLSATGVSVSAAMAALGGNIAAPLKTTKPPKGSKRFKQLVLRQLPKPLKDKFESSADLFAEFLKAPHNRLAGRTNAGKSYLTSTILCLYLDKFPDAHIVVCDRNYGKPKTRGSGKPSKPHDWNGLPRECLRVTDGDIDRAVDEELKELGRRIAIARESAFEGKLVPPFNPRLLILDEFDSTQEILNEGKGATGPFSSKIKSLINQGHGYNMKVVLVGQKLSVGESGINLATATTFATAFLGTDTLDTGIVSYLDKHKASELSGDCAAIAAEGKRPAIIQLPTGVTKAIAVPDLTEYGESRIHYAGAAITDEDKRTWNAILTEDKRQELVKLAEGLRDGRLSAPPKSGGPVKGLVLPTLGLKPSDVGKPIWKEYGKPTWESIVKSVEL
jgi:hypothetical protein